jgi:hypothetical protein
MSTANSKIKVGVVFLGRRRPGFDMEWGKQMETRVRGSLAKSGFEFFEASEKAVDDPSLRGVMADCEAQKIDALVLLQTTMGDARLSQTLAQLWPDPLILWATPEKPTVASMMPTTMPIRNLMLPPSGFQVLQLTEPVGCLYQGNLCTKYHPSSHSSIRHHKIQLDLGTAQTCGLPSTQCQSRRDRDHKRCTSSQWPAQTHHALRQAVQTC